MSYGEFAETANRMWDRVPDAYKEGIDGLVLRREAETHPDHGDFFTLGTCSTEPYPSGYGGPESTRSILALYYGSFRAVARSDPEFDWEGEIWETVTHELRHHLEFLVEDSALEGVDYAVEQAHLREAGLEFDPWYFQSGLLVAPGVYRVESEIYIEQRWSQTDFDRSDALEFEWEERRWRLPRPGRLGDLHFIRIIGGVPADTEFTLVLVRDRSLRDRVRRVWRGGSVRLFESEAFAEALRR